MTGPRDAAAVAAAARATRERPSLLEARDRREPEVTALRREVARLTASCEHMRAVIAFARRQTSLQDCLRALDGA